MGDEKGRDTNGLRRAYEQALAEYRGVLPLLDDPKTPAAERQRAEDVRLRFGAAKRAYFDAVGKWD